MPTSNGAAADPFRVGKTYSVGEAARLAHTTAATVRRWILGYEAPGHRMLPVFPRIEEIESGRRLEVSFLELAEVVVAVRFRQTGVMLERVRRAHLFARHELGVPYPFASLRLAVFGGEVLRRFEVIDPGAGRFAVLGPRQQYVLPGTVVTELSHFQFAEDELAERWFPYGPDVPIVVDPHYGGGKPTVAGRGVTVEIVAKRWRAGESILSIARDFHLNPPVVEAVLQRAA